MKYSILTAFIFISVLVNAQSTYVPDNNFEAYLEQNGMGDGIHQNDHVFTENITNVQTLDISDENLSDFTGIEDFHSLKYFTAKNNSSSANSTLDLRHQLDLIEVDLRNSPIESILLPETETLERLHLGGCHITEIDISQNPNLYYAILNNNNISQIDLGNNPNLRTLDLSSNLLSEIDVTSNVQLEIFSVANNSFEEIDLGTLTALQAISIADNSITDINLASNDQLTHVDIQDNTLNCLNIRNGNNSELLGLTLNGNPQLTCIQVDDDHISMSDEFALDDQMYFDRDCDCSVSVGINDIENISSNVHLYPNPSNGIFKIDMGDNKAESIQIYDSVGKFVSNLPSGQSNPDFAVDLGSGIYTLNIQLENGLIASKKLVIQ